MDGTVMAETTQQRLERLMSLRSDLEQTLRQRIAELREERRQMVEQYDGEISDLESQLRAVGVPIPEAIGSGSHNSTAAERVVDLLSDTPGTWVTSREINRQLGMTGVLRIILAEPIPAGRPVRRVGAAGPVGRDGRERAGEPGRAEPLVQGGADGAHRRAEQRGHIMQLTTLTHSAEQAFKSCPRRYHLAYVQQLRPAHQTDALRIGSAFHLGLEVAKSGGDERAAADAVWAAYADATVPPWMDVDAFAVERAIATTMVRGWCRRWAADRIVDYVAVEQAFDLPVVNPTTGRELPGYRNRGKIDGVCRLPDGRLALIEHKTTSDDPAAGGDYWRRMLIDGQVSRYMLAARTLGYDVATTVYDVTRKPSIRPKAIAKADRHLATVDGHYHRHPLTTTCPDRETPELYAARLLADMADRPDWYFARCEVPRLEADLEEFAAESWVVAGQVRRAAEDELQWGLAAWPRNGGACTAPYRCAYLDVCRGCGGDPSNEVPPGFVRVADPHPELAV